MTDSPIARGLKLSVCALAALAALGLANPASAGAVDANGLMTTAAGGVVKNLQLGVGKSVIVDLPEDAAEIYRRRSHRRQCDRPLGAARLRLRRCERADEHFRARQGRPQDRDRRRHRSAATSANSQSLLNAAIPGNDIHVRTVADSIILTGSVASAGDAQKALDIAERLRRRLGGSVRSSAAAAMAPRRGHDASRQGHQLADHPRSRSGQPARDDHRNPPRDRQAARRQHSAATRRQRLEQLQRSTIRLRSTARSPRPQASSAGRSAARTCSAQLQAFERQGVAHTLAEPTVTAVSGESAKFLAGGTIPIPTSETCTQRRLLRSAIVAAALWRDAELHAGRAVARAHPAAHRDRSHRDRLFDADHRRSAHRCRASAPASNETTVELPSGGSIVIGGLDRDRRRNRRSTGCRA